MSDCRFGVSPINYPDPDSDPDEQNAAISYIIVHLTYIRGLIHGIGRGVPNASEICKPVALSALTCRFSPFALWDLADFG